MRNVVLALVVAIVTFDSSATAASAAGVPNLGRLQLVTQLPPELPQRIMGLAYDGQKLWATIYLGRGQYATLDPSSLVWKISEQEKQHKAIGKVSGALKVQERSVS